METGERDDQNRGLERTAHQLKSTGVEDSSNALRSGIHTRGYLPHVKREGACYFVTFRLADSLPQSVLLNLERQKADQLRQLHSDGSKPTPEAVRNVSREFHRKIERFLDSGEGACHLRNPAIAALVAQALSHFDQSRYVLHEWVIMPNHVHAIVWPMPNHLLSGILKSWKQYTARHGKRLLGLKTEEFWQREAYDHWIRNDEEKARIARYIRNNPVSAGLCARPEDWQWSSARPNS